MFRRSQFPTRVEGLSISSSLKCSSAYAALQRHTSLRSRRMMAAPFATLHRALGYTRPCPLTRSGRRIALRTVRHAFSVAKRHEQHRTSGLATPLPFRPTLPQRSHTVRQEPAIRLLIRCASSLASRNSSAATLETLVGWQRGPAYRRLPLPWTDGATCRDFTDSRPILVGRGSFGAPRPFESIVLAWSRPLLSP